MGNRAKRVKLAKALKEHGFGRLYTGNKRVAWSLLWSSHMEELLLKLRFKNGDVANDCDGLNHRVVEWLVERREFIIGVKGSTKAGSSAWPSSSVKMVVTRVAALLDLNRPRQERK
jgi:hypothetical protein